MRTPHFIRKWQHKRKYGLTCCDVSGLHNYFTPKLLNGIKAFRAKADSPFFGYPSKVGSIEEWNAILEKIQQTFELIERVEQGEDWEWDEKEREKNFKEIDKGLALFAKYYLNLWW